MRKIFLWFYCLPIGEALIYIGLTTLICIFLHNRFKKSPLWKSCNIVFLICWIGAIFLGTLLQRTAGHSSSRPVLMPFYSYYIALHGGSQEIYRTNFMNTVFFYPTGLLGSAILPGSWPRIRKILLVAVCFTVLSIAIEFIQYRFGLGIAEMDDVIHNALGTLLGALVFSIFVK